MIGRWSGQYGPEPEVRPQQRDVREEREQPDRLRREPSDDRQADRPVEADALPAGADEHRPAARPLDHDRRLEARVRRGDVRDVLRRVDLVPDDAGQRLGDEDEPPPRQHRDRRTGERRDLAGPRPGGVDHERRTDRGLVGRVGLHARHLAARVAIDRRDRRPEVDRGAGLARPPQERRGRQHRLDLGVLRVPGAARDVAGQVRLERREARPRPPPRPSRPPPAAPPRDRPARRASPPAAPRPRRPSARTRARPRRARRPAPAIAPPTGGRASARRPAACPRRGCSPPRRSSCRPRCRPGPRRRPAARPRSAHGRTPRRRCRHR